MMMRCGRRLFLQVALWFPPVLPGWVGIGGSES